MFVLSDAGGRMLAAVALLGEQSSGGEGQLGFYDPLDTKQVISETFSRASLLAWYGEKTQPITTKARTRQSKKNVLFFSRPRSEGWPHHGRTFSIYLCPLLF